MNLKVVQCSGGGRTWREFDRYHTVELDQDDYARFIFTLRAANTPDSRKLARELFLVHTGMWRCDKCGTMSYTTVGISTGWEEWRECRWCSCKQHPDLVNSPATYGVPCRKPRRKKSKKGE